MASLSTGYGTPAWIDNRCNENENVKHEQEGKRQKIASSKKVGKYER